MYHIVYKTTNILNGRYYIGKHSTKKLNDGYIGSGHALINAVKKYGKKNFIMEYLFFAFSEKFAYEIEALFVNHEILKDALCYNLQTGGNGAFCPSESVKLKISEKLKGCKRSATSIEKQKNSMIGVPRTTDARKSISLSKTSLYKFTTPNNEVIEWFGVLKTFCDAHNLSLDKVRRYINKGVITPSNRDVSDKVRNTIGWSVTKWP